MKNSRKIQTWWDIYLSLHENGRIHIGEICRRMKYTGRGKNRDTISRYLNEAFEKGIITKPQLTLANHKKSTLYVYLLQCKENRTKIFNALKTHPDVLYMALLNGDYQILFTSRSNQVSPACSHTISPIFTPVYTSPQGWSYSEQQCLNIITDYTYTENTLSRTVRRPLDWDPLDWKIYNTFRLDLRMSLKDAAALLNASYETIRLRLNKILPQTIQIVGFFPQGMGNYTNLFFLIKTPCERSFVSVLSKLQTSCLIWPLQDHLLCLVYFQNLSIFFKSVYNLEKKKIFDEYRFLFPLEYFDRELAWRRESSTNSSTIWSDNTTKGFEGES